MPHDPRMHLEHVRDSIRLIERYVAGLTFEAYLSQTQTRDAVERRFAIIGEALKRDAPHLHARISDTGPINAFRNVLVHVYDMVDHQIVWKAIRTDLPTLRDEVIELLDGWGED